MAHVPALPQNIGSALASAGSSLLASFFNAREAKKNRDWQEKMSNTAYQRAVSDMQKAGLNPALVYGQSAPAASTPSGSSATASAPLISMSEMLESKKVSAEIDVLESEAARNRADAGYTEAQTGRYQELTDIQLASMRAAIESSEARAALDRAGISQTEANALLSFYDACMAATDLETRDRMNRLQLEYLQAQANRDNAAASELLSQIRVNEQALVESAARVNNFDAQTLNYLEENGVIRLNKEKGSWEVEHLGADRVWDKVGSVLDMAGETAGIIMTGGAFYAGAKALGSAAGAASALRPSAGHYGVGRSTFGRVYSKPKYTYQLRPNSGYGYSRIGKR